MTTLNTNFLSTLTTPQRQDIENISSVKLLSHREMPLNASTPLNNVFIIKSGRIKIYEISDTGKQIILWFCFPGEIFGLAELNINNDRKIYAESCNKSELLSIHSHDFNQFLFKHHAISLYLIDLLTHRMQLLAEQLLNCTSDDVTTRLIKLLGRFSKYTAASSTHHHSQFKLTHQEIADMLGASRQTITSTISQLKKSGIIDSDKGSLRLLDQAPA